MGFGFLLPGKCRRRGGSRRAGRCLQLSFSSPRCGQETKARDAPATRGSLAHTLPALLICNILSVTHWRSRSGADTLGGGRDASAVPALPRQSPVPGAAFSTHGKNRAALYAALEANAGALERCNSLNVPRVMEMLSSPR